MLGIFLDFTNAFDCVHHGILLQHYNHVPFVVSPSNIDLNQCVHVSSVLSNKSPNKPRSIWSIPEPILFIIYVNKITSSVSQYGKLVIYAYDKNLCLKGKSIEELEILSFIELVYLIRCLSEIKLATNIKIQSTMLNFSLRQQHLAVQPAVLTYFKKGGVYRRLCSFGGICIHQIFGNIFRSRFDVGESHKLDHICTKFASGILLYGV